MDAKATRIPYRLPLNIVAGEYDPEKDRILKLYKKVKPTHTCNLITTITNRATFHQTGICNFALESFALEN